MKLAFMGSAEFAIPALDALVAAGHEIVAVYAQPPRPAGRGRHETAVPLARFARESGLSVRTPVSLKKNAAEWAAFAAFALDAAVVAAYGLILPREMLSLPKRGILNIHASLLPRWRGAAPVQAAVLAGDAQTGVTIMQVEARLDAGLILLAESVPIAPDATAGRLTKTLGALGGRLIVEALAQSPEPCAQDEARATYAPQLTRADGRLDWRLPAARLARQVRAFDPWPQSFCRLGALSLKVLAAEAGPTSTNEPPGTILDQAMRIACGEGAIELVSVQPAGGKPMSGADFLRGSGRTHGAGVGSRLT